MFKSVKIFSRKNFNFNQFIILNLLLLKLKNSFEEPKPEKCKICGKGFKNVPALNGHMRLHGGFIKKVKKLKTCHLETISTN